MDPVIERLGLGFEFVLSGVTTTRFFFHSLRVVGKICCLVGIGLTSENLGRLLTQRLKYYDRLHQNLQREGFGFN